MALVSEGQKAYDEMRRAEGRTEGRKEGLQEGRKEGLQEGRKEGLQEGRKEGLQEAVKNLMRTAKVSEQEARRLLCLDGGPASSRSPGAKKMDLN